jgi:nucleotide-binding universal stress UspA family protein
MASTLVVLTDFFAVDNLALTYAAGLAAPLGSELVLLHAQHDALLAPAGYGPASPISEYTTSLALQALADGQPVPAQVEVSDRELPAAVAHAVRHYHPLLLVLGPPSGPAPSGRVLTETAIDLLATVPCPLLLVPAAAGRGAIHPPRRLLLAVDGEPFALRQHQDVLRQLLRANQATLGVVRVTDDSHARLSPAAVRALVLANDLVDATDLLADQVCEVASATPTHGVLAEATRQGADMLVVVARRHSVLGSLVHRSITTELIEQSPIPVLLLPAED